MLICSAIVPITVGFYVKVSRTEQPSIIGGGKTLYVGGNGPNNYTKIQDAIDNASDGDTVFVFSGLYIEGEIEIEKSINLIGEDKETTIIDGNQSLWVIGLINMYKVERVEVTGFTIQNGRTGLVHDTGINSEKNIKNEKNEYLSSAGIYDNIFRDNENGIVLGWWSSNVGIGKNEVLGNEIGVILIYSEYNSIYKNTIVNNDIGIYLVIGCHENSIDSNIISYNKKNGIYLDNIGFNEICYNTISYNEYDGILVDNSYGVFEKNQIYQNNGSGISVFNNSGGFWIYNNEIFNNKLHGIKFQNCNLSGIADNNIYGHKSGCGISLQESENNRNLIEKNKIEDNKFGINITGNENDINNNTIKDNSKIGVLLESSNSNVISDNDIKDNFMGVYLDKSSRNKITSNNFQNNKRSASFIRNFNNHWDKNYWNSPRKYPYLIWGRVGFFLFLIPWFNIDWHPAKEPYDIEGII